MTFRTKILSDILARYHGMFASGNMVVNDAMEYPEMKSVLKALKILKISCCVDVEWE